jgi:hypothetical protein
VSREHRLERFSHLPRLEPELGILGTAQRELWPILGDVPEDFVLYGGTGLALHLGHRPSADFDFVSACSFVPTDLLAELSWLGRVTINQAAPGSLDLSTRTGVRLSFLGGMTLQVVAEPSMAAENGLVIASVFDLAGTKAKAILDRSEWKDYVDIATLLRAGHSVPDIIGYANTIFDLLFEFPAATFLRALVYFEAGTASDVPDDMRRELEAAVVLAEHEAIRIFEPYGASIRP